MVLVTGALAAPVGVHRIHSCAEGKGRCSDLAAVGVQVLVGYREVLVWELVVDRVRSTGTAVERKDCFGNPFCTFLNPRVGGRFWCRQMVLIIFVWPCRIFWEE